MNPKRAYDFTFEFLIELIRDFANQYALPVDVGGVAHLDSGSIGVLEDAFDVLGWSDPHPCPWRECKAEGCRRHGSVTYCSDHWNVRG